MILNAGAGEAAQRAIVIVGAARSGTTMMGTLLGSLQQIEYLHEPPLLHSLLTQIDILPATSWRLLYETYLFEDFLIDAVAGRRLNLNRNDESSVYHSKSAAEVQSRLARSWRRTEAYPEARNRRICYKIPDMVGFLGRLFSIYSEMTTVVMIRRAESVIRSLLERGWYSDCGLSGVTGIWPNHPSAPPYAPYWLPAAEIETWRHMSEIERCCYYYVTLYGDLPDHPGIVAVDYDRFVRDAPRQLSHIAARLGHNFGSQTDPLLAKIAEPAGDRVVNLSMVPSALLERLRATEAKIKNRALE